VERNFAYIEGNFLAGRTFRDWNDLNEQLLQWLVEIANKKPKRSLGMSPDEAYLMEKKRLIRLPAHIPPVYQTLHRVVDIYGYVNVDRNRYSAPERLVGKQVEVHKSVSRINIFFKNKKVADHERCDGRDKKIKAPGHHTPCGAGKKRRGPCREEKILVEADSWLSPYVVEIKKRSRGRGVRKMRDLLSLKRTYPAEAFEKAVRQALHYGLYDLGRLERLILSFVAGEFFDLDDE
jgi:hypothetical protein